MDEQNQAEETGRKLLNAADEDDQKGGPLQKPRRVLTADMILGAEDIGIEEVPVPEWGGVVFVRAMTSLQREKYLDSMRQTINEGGRITQKVILAFGGAKLAALTLCDQDGKLLFERDEVTIGKLAKKSAKAMERVVEVSARLNGLDDEKERLAASKNAGAALMETETGSGIA